MSLSKLINRSQLSRVLLIDEKKRYFQNNLKRCFNVKTKCFQAPNQELPPKAEQQVAYRVISGLYLALGVGTGFLLGYFTGLADQYWLEGTPASRVLVLSHPNPVPINHGPAKTVSRA